MCQESSREGEAVPDGENQGNFLDKAMHKDEKCEQVKKEAWGRHGYQELVSQRR